MSPELQKYIAALPVHTFLLSGDLLVIGRLVKSEEGVVHVNALYLIETIMDENSMSQVLLPYLPSSIEETSIIFRQHVILQTPASFQLKKSYCDALLRTKINGIPELNLSSSIDLETNNQFPTSDQFKNRWNN